MTGDAIKTFLLATIPGAIDGVARWVDGHMSPGGRRTKLGRLLGLRDHSPLVFLLPLPVLFFVAFGPTIVAPDGVKGPPHTHVIAAFANRGPVTLGVAGGLLLAALALTRLLRRWPDAIRWAHFGLLAGGAFVTWTVAGERTIYDQPAGPYRNVYLVLAVLVMTAAIPVGWLLARACFRWFGAQDLPIFGQSPRCDRLLDAERREAGDSWFGVLRAYVAVPARSPVQLLVPPAVGVVLAPPSYGTVRVAVVLVVLNWMLLAAASYHPGRDAMVRLTRRAFLAGGAFFVSAFLVVLAVGRVFDVSYIRTVLDSQQVTLPLSTAILAAYALCWWAGYWADRAVVEHVLRLIGRLDRRDPGQAVAFGAGSLEAWGGNRLLLRSPGREPRDYEPIRLLDELADDLEGDAGGWAVRELEQRLRFYRGVLLALPVATIALVAAVAHDSLPQRAAIEATEVRWERASYPDDESRYSLAEVLAARPPDGDPVILLAASGGGTRAALYTAAVLRGLDELGRLDDLAVASGVSGGSAAIACFAARRDVLAGPAAADAEARETAWRDYRDVLAHPFIAEVLRAVPEWRVAGSTRTGHLLTESFERHFYRIPDGSATARRRLGASADRLGLIFNAGLCGEEKRGRDVDGREVVTGDAAGAGGRLVVTNLAELGSVPAGASDAAWRLPYVIVDDPEVELAAAAAVSANFPPVFSNAAVDLIDPAAAEGTERWTRRFWVTDGGAVENRGLLTLLLALRASLETLAVNGELPPMAPIRVLVADASAFGAELRQDRGVGAVVGAAPKVANQLILELVADLRRRRVDLEVVPLTMPDWLRVSGSFGTHWMMPPWVRLARGTEEASLREEDLLELVFDLFVVEPPLPAGETDVERVKRWAVDEGLRSKLADALD